MRLRLSPSAPAVTQATNKSTAVVLNGRCGVITMNNASLAAATSVSFTVTNDAIGMTDIPVVALASGGTAGSYLVTIGAVAAGSCVVHVRNLTAGALGEALVLNFGVLKTAN